MCVIGCIGFSLGIFVYMNAWPPGPQTATINNVRSIQISSYHSRYVVSHGVVKAPASLYPICVRSEHDSTVSLSDIWSDLGFEETPG